MKKHILSIIVLLFTATYSRAYVNDNKKATSSPAEMEKIGQKFDKLNGTKQVPTIIKYSELASNFTGWQEKTLEEYIYENNLVKSVITYSYDGTDTLSRITLSYNTDNYLLLYFDEKYIGAGLYEPFERINYVYEDNYNKITSIGESYDKNTNTWTPEVKLIDEKINNGETSRALKYFYSNNNWKGYTGKSHTIKKLNSTTSKVTEIIDSIFNFSSGEFEIKENESRIYDANENVILIVYSKYNGGIFQRVKADSIYYVNNIPSEQITYNYDMDGFVYNTNKLTNMVWRNYNPNIDINENILTDFTSHVYTAPNWVPQGRTSIVYTDSYGSYTHYQESYVSNNWIPLFRARNLYNQYNHKIFECRELHDRVNWDTVYCYQSVVIYDLNDNMIENTQFIFSDLTLSWQKRYKYEYSNFITISTGITSTNKTIETRLYPNPSTNGSVNINVNLEAASALTIKVSDMKGSIVYTDERNVGKGLNTIELKNLTKGVFVVELSTELGVSRTKLIVNGEL